MNTKKMFIFILLIQLSLIGIVHAGGYINVSWFDSSNQYIGEKIWQATNESEGWHLLYDNVTSPPNAAYARITLGNQFDSQTRYVYFDDVGLIASGFRRTTCTASSECDERSPGDVWCDGNMKKTCDSNCGVLTQETCRADAEDTDALELDPYLVRGTVTDYLGCINGDCHSESGTDACKCTPKCKFGEGSDESYCGADKIFYCAKYQDKDDCNNDSECYWALMEYKVSGDGYSKEQEYKNCTEYGQLYSCIYDKCTTHDVLGDNYVGVDDIFAVASSFGTQPGDQNWDPRCDIDGNGYVGIDDIFEVAQHFGEGM